MEIMALLAFCSTMGLYGTSLPLFPLLLTAGRSDLVQFSSLILKLVNNFLGCHYAVLAAVRVSALSNGLGVLLHSLLCLAYLRVVPVKSGPSIFFFLGLIFYAAVAAFYFNDAVSIGLIGSSVRTLAYASPALTVVEAAKTGNVDAISLPLTCGAFVCQVTWYVFGGLIDDPFVQLPNVPGIVVQIAAFYLLWKDDQKKKIGGGGGGKDAVADADAPSESSGEENTVDSDNNLLSKKTD